MSKVELVKGTAFELDPAKQYLLVFEQNMISLEDLSQLLKALGKEGFKGLGVVIAGDPNSIKVIEQVQ